MSGSFTWGWRQQRIEPSTRGEGWTIVGIDEDFSRAVTLVVSVIAECPKAGDMHQPHIGALNVFLSDSLDAEWWGRLDGGLVFGHHTFRVSRPMGARLRIGLKPEIRHWKGSGYAECEGFCKVDHEPLVPTDIRIQLLARTI